MIYKRLNKELVDNINRTNNKIVIEFYNTKSFNTKLLNYIKNNNCPKDCFIKKIDKNCNKTYKMFGENYNSINTINYNDVFKNVVKMLDEERAKI